MEATATESIWQIEPAGGPLRGGYHPPGDRSLTHRALILGALAIGPTQLSGALESADTVCTRRVLAHLGVSFTVDDEGWLVVARSGRRLERPDVELDCGRSASTMRLMAGVLAGQPFGSLLTGDDELLNRPLDHLALPLRQMGAEVECLGPGGRPPLRIKGQPLFPLVFEIPPEMPELKGPLLLASLFGVGVSRLGVAGLVRDHTERLLRHLGVSVGRKDDTITLKGEQHIHPRRMKIPGDMSAASAFLIAASLVPGSAITVHQVGTNPARVGLLKTLARVGGNVERIRDWQYGSEPVGSFRVAYAPAVQPFNVAPNLAPSLMDELPLLALLATQAQGTSSLRGGTALGRRTPDRLHLTSQILRDFGADVELERDGFTVHGPTQLHGAEVNCAGDHRMVMLATVAALIADSPSVLLGADVVNASYPGFLTDLEQLLAGAHLEDTGEE